LSSTLAIRDIPDGCTLPVRVHPGARRNAIAGIHDGALKVSLTTPPTWVPSDRSSSLGWSVERATMLRKPR
jgi:hypothetical protein